MANTVVFLERQELEEVVHQIVSKAAGLSSAVAKAKREAEEQSKALLATQFLPFYRNWISARAAVEAEVGNLSSDSPYNPLKPDEAREHKRLLDKKVSHELWLKKDPLFRNKRYLPLTAKQRQEFSALEAKIDAELQKRHKALDNSLNELRPATKSAIASGYQVQINVYWLLTSVFGEGHEEKIGASTFRQPFKGTITEEVMRCLTQQSAPVELERTARIFYALQFLDAERLLAASSPTQHAGKERTFLGYYGDRYVEKHSPRTYWSSVTNDLVFSSRTNPLSAHLIGLMAMNLLEVAKAIAAYKADAKPATPSVYHGIAQNLLSRGTYLARGPSGAWETKLIGREEIMTATLETALKLGELADLHGVGWQLEACYVAKRENLQLRLPTAVTA